MESLSPEPHRGGSIHPPLLSPAVGAVGAHGGGPGGSASSAEALRARPLPLASGVPLAGEDSQHHFAHQWDVNQQQRTYQSQLANPQSQAHLSYQPLAGYTYPVRAASWDRPAGDLSSSSTRTSSASLSPSNQPTTTPSSSIYNPAYMPYQLPAQPSISNLHGSFGPTHHNHHHPTPDQFNQPLITNHSPIDHPPNHPSAIYSPYPTSAPATSLHQARFSQPGRSSGLSGITPALSPSLDSQPLGPDTEEGSDERTVSSGVTDGGIVIKRERKKRRLKGEIPRDHESLGKYQCDECQARFARPSALATHTVSKSPRPTPPHCHSFLRTKLTVVCLRRNDQLTHTKEKRKSQHDG